MSKILASTESSAQQRFPLPAEGKHREKNEQKIGNKHRGNNRGEFTERSTKKKQRNKAGKKN